MWRHVLTAAILVAALGCYAAGMAGGGMLLLLLGASLELWFWVRAMGSSKRSPGTAPRGRT